MAAKPEKTGLASEECSEVSIISCYAVVYNMENRKWIVTGKGGWSEVHLCQDVKDKSCRIIAWTTSKAQNVLMNCNIESECKYIKKSKNFHVFTETSGTQYGLGFHKSDAGIQQATKFHKSIISKINTINHWVLMEDPPMDKIHDCIKLSNNEMIYIKTDGVYIWNISTNETNLQWKHRFDDTKYHLFTAVIHRVRYQLCVYCSAASDLSCNLVVVDMVTNKVTTTDLKTTPKVISPAVVVIEDEYNLVGGMYGGHFILDKNMDKVHKIHELTQWKNGCNINYIESRDMMLLIGGKRYDDIWRFTLNDRKWSLLDTKLAFPRRAIESVITHNEEFMIIFGGKRSISVMDLNTMKIKICALKTPEDRSGPRYKTIITHENHQDMLVDGYVRTSWKMEKLNECYVLPNDIIEYLHLFTFKEETRHWMINVNNIFQSL